MIDFSLSIYKKLLETLIAKTYKFQTVEEYFTHKVSSSPSRSLSSSPRRQFVIMRHDVDRKPKNALRMAKLEAELGIQATYYFRTIAKTLKPAIIKQIAELGHEIGYHYENLCDAEVQIKNLKFKIENYEEKLFELALEDFKINLARLREIVPIKNICMHGSPLSMWDSRDLWKKYNYKDYGIVSEPYFDLDFSKVQYITDAGRSWDNAAINLRDKVESPYHNDFKHTNYIIKAVQNNKLSKQIMFNIHPEHWAASMSEWVKIWGVRKVKNAVKRVVIGRR